MYVIENRRRTICCVLVLAHLIDTLKNEPMRPALFNIIVILLLALPLMATEVDVATNNGNFLEYDTGTGNYTLLGNSSAVLYGLGYTSGGILYGNDSNSAPNTGFYQVNPTNGALTFVANLTGSVSGVGAMTAPSNGGTLYYLDHSDNLFTINPSTGATTKIGSLGFTVTGSFDLAFAPNGNLYATASENFYLINPSTGAGTLIGNSGAELQALVSGDGNLYGFSGTSMYSINLSNGQLAFIRNTPTALGSFETDADVFAGTSTPEPAAATLSIAGLLAFAGVVKVVRFRNGAAQSTL